MLGRRIIDLHRLSPSLVARINTIASQKFPTLYQRQHLHLAPQRLKWISNEQAKRVAPVAVGMKAGHADDPSVNTADRDYLGSPEKGDPVIESKYFYRPMDDFPVTYFERVSVYILTTLIWFWIFYRLYHDHGMLIGHFYTPYTEEFTDEELGIPPDDAPDPEYWGSHHLKYGTYR